MRLTGFMSGYLWPATPEIASCASLPPIDSEADVGSRGSRGAREPWAFHDQIQLHEDE